MFFLLAQAGGEGSTVDWTNIAQYGVLGLVVLAFIFGKIVPGYIYEKAKQEHEAEKAENRELEKTVKEQVIPALLRSTDMMAQVLDLLNELDRDQPTKRPR